MTPELESKLRAAMATCKTPRDAIQVMVERGDIASAKQAWRTLEKWAKRGEYSYGVSLDLGWLEKAKPGPAP